MLSPSARRLLLINGCFSLANGLSGIFTTVYLWRLRPGVTTPAYYNLWTFLTILFVMPLGGAYVKRKGAAGVNAVAMLLYSGFYLTLLLLQEQAVNYLPFLGIFMGMALGGYALATHVLAYDLTDDSNRELYYNRNGLFTSVAGLLAPVTAGWIVSGFPGLAGYRVIFMVSFVVFAAAAVLGMSLKAAKPGSPYQLRAVLQSTHRGWRWMLLTYGVNGLRDGIFGFTVSLLVYLATGGERSLGNFTFLTSAVGIAAFFLVGRVLRRENRHRVFPIGAVLMGLATGVVSLGATWQVMLAHGLLFALAAPLFQTAYSAAGFDVIKSASANQDLRVEMIGAREIPLNLGRMASLVLILNFAPTGEGGTIFLRLLLAVMGLTFPLVWFLTNKALRASNVQP